MVKKAASKLRLYGVYIKHSGISSEKPTGSRGAFRLNGKHSALILIGLDGEDSLPFHLYFDLSNMQKTPILTQLLS